MEQRNADRIGLSLTVYKQRVLNQWWLDAKESVKSGAADKRVDVICSLDLVAEDDIMQVETLFGATTVKFSGCPLIRTPIGNADEQE